MILRTIGLSRGLVGSRVGPHTTNLPSTRWQHKSINLGGKRGGSCETPAQPVSHHVDGSPPSSGSSHAAAARCACVLDVAGREVASRAEAIGREREAPSVATCHASVTRLVVSFFLSSQ